MYMWKQCPKAWSFSYVDGLKKKSSAKVFFEVGLYFHELVHVYYQALQAGHHKPGSEFLINYMNSRIRKDIETVKSDSINIISTVSKMLTSYVATWSPILDKNITVLGVEKNIQVPVTLPSGNEVILNCITDLIYRLPDGSITIRDHKTGQANSWNQQMMPLENQTLFNAVAYFLLTGEKPLRRQISFINSYDYKRKEPSLQERFASFVHVDNEKAFDNYTAELLKTLDRMVAETDPVRFYSKDCSKCQFNAICTQEIRGFLGSMCYFQHVQI